MLKKLKSASQTLKSTSSPLFLKGTVYAILLFFASYFGGIFWAGVFLIGTFYFYFEHFLRWRKFLYSFFVLTVYSLIIADFLIDPFFIFIVSVLFGTMFAFLLGIKNLEFTNRKTKFNFLSSALYFMVAVAFFVADKNTGGKFFIYYLGTFLALYGLMKEILDFLSDDFPKTRKSLLTIGGSLIIMELLAVVALLPIGFLNSSALILLFIFILEDFIFYHLKGNLDKQVIINNAILFAVAVAFIFATSRWTL